MHLNDLSDKKGIIIDGYPRDLDQVKDFEQMVCVDSKFVICFVVDRLISTDNKISHLSLSVSSTTAGSSVGLLEATIGPWTLRRYSLFI